MAWFVIAIIVAAVIYVWVKRKISRPDLTILPERFVVFDLETTGLKPDTHEIIEIGAIRVNRDSGKHDTFQALVRPTKKIPKKITGITGITQDMVEKDGDFLETALPQFIEFVSDLPLVSFNAEFDMAFLNAAISKTQVGALANNRVSCALKMARRAWPGRKSYRLSDLAKDGRLSSDDTHRALGDCKRAMVVYTAAAAKLRSAT
ncbi:DNA polymerase III PolC-type [Sedimentisphaera cyanobacteriorum]|uniref:DNA polymerase III PolC-type n=1 Tax=Sedimentisphaera cyanobacteriorum TaxID=1940790 RepID=A0A1Q2HRL0_9BACT|nr:3'-5' exonuclease [Sedimentisphaera cyanobacteriorum]AQQ09863.1 DNA polymerase III PolC-type [Sedimentisphaera cyanobacteriorum]